MYRGKIRTFISVPTDLNITTLLLLLLIIFFSTKKKKKKKIFVAEK